MPEPTTGGAITSSSAVVERVIDADREAVWSVLADGWLYPGWVVGASRMRAVDDTWPAVGSKLHHSVGTWPVLIDDRTEVLESEPGSLLRLRAHAWPSGAAEVLIELADHTGSRPGERATLVRMQEDASNGPALLMPRPLRKLGLLPRNRETLRRLAFLAEGRAA